MEQVLKNIYRIEVPLPNNPLRTLNAYLLIGDKRHLLIDTGFKRRECLQALEQAFEELNVDKEDLDIFITHLHADHSGLVSTIASPKTKVYCSRQDGELINGLSNEEYWNSMDEKFSKHGMPNPQDDPHKGIHPGQLFSGQAQIHFTYVKDGDCLCVGDYFFRCIHTPGHSPGHMCLYEENQKILFSGDHILGHITPVICIEEGMNNPLSLYLQSLKKIKKFEIQMLLTAHREQVPNAQDRIEELEEHHNRRLKEVVSIIKNAQRPFNAYEVAEKMTWNSPFKSWDAFPRQQRWFATGEAMAHLLYLWEGGQAEKSFHDNRYYFFKT